MKSLVKELTHLAMAVGRLGVLVFGFGHSFVGMRHYWEGSDPLASINNLAIALVFFVLYLLNWTIDKGKEQRPLA